MSERSIVVTLRLDNQQQVRALGAMKAEFILVGDKIKLLNSIIRENGTATKGQERQLGELTAKARNLSVQIRELSNNLSGATAAGLRFRDKMADAARAGLGAFGINVLGVAAAVTAAVRVFQDAGRTIAEFDQGLANIRALGPDTAARIDDIAEAAKTAGIAFGFTAKESLDAIEALAKAGVSVDDILSGALTGTLTLAAAGEIEVADAAETAAKAMTQFGLKGQDVVHIGDLLTAGALKAVGGVKELNDALALSGLTAAQFGITIDDTIGALTAFAANGLLGEQAGAAFQQALLKLANPSKEASKTLKQLGIEVFDAQGNFVGLAKLAGELQDKMKGLTQEQRTEALATIFGSRAIRAANVLYKEGEQGIRDYIAAVNDNGIAARVAAEKQDSLSGAINQLNAAYKAFILSLEDGQGTLAKAVRAIVQITTGIFQGLSGGSADIQKFDKRLDDFAARVTSKLRALGDEVTTIANGSSVSQALKDRLDRESALVEFAVNRNINDLERLAKARQNIADDVDQAGLSGNKRELAFAQARLELFDELVAKAQETGKAVAGAAEAGADAQEDASKRTLAAIKAEIAEQKKLQEATTNRKDFLDIQKTIDALEKEAAAIEGVTAKAAKVKKLTDEFASLRKELEAIENTQRPKTELGDIDAVNKQFDGFIERAKGNAELIQRIEEGRVAALGKILSDYAAQRAENEAAITANEKTEFDARVQQLDAYAQAMGDINERLRQMQSEMAAQIVGSIGEFTDAIAGLSEGSKDAAKQLLAISKILGIGEVVIRLQQELAANNAIYVGPLAPVGVGLNIAAGFRAATRIATIVAAASPGFAEGGYTEPGHKSRPVGVVHAGEWVAPQRMVKDDRFRPILDWLESQRRGMGVTAAPFASGGFTPVIDIPTPSASQLVQIQQVSEARAFVLQPVLVLEHLRTVENRVDVLERLSRA